MSLIETVALARRHGSQKIALCIHDTAPPDSLIPVAKQLGIAGLIVTGRAPVNGLSAQAAAAAGIDGVVIADEAGFRAAMRGLEPLAHAGALVLPQEADWVAPANLRAMSPSDAAWNTTTDTNYVARSAMRGHYLEFGTFWGSSFFPRYFQYRGWLQGRFYGFDSFAGLSQPLAAEIAYTGGDFQAGSYCCNERSFRAIADLVGLPAEKLVVVPGFYENSLAGAGRAAELGLAPQSVSVCAIDCDLRAPTESVLDFVLPLLEPGALIYFDDWRLCRASREVGERAAALAWMERHPDIELIELHRDFWQHQWFIFHRRH